MKYEKNIRNIVNQEQNAPQKTAQKEKNPLKKTSIDNVDLEELNNQNMRNYTGNSNRKRVVIVILTILLIASLVVVVVLWNLNRTKNNCFLHSSGASVDFYVDDEKLTEFKSPYGLTGNRIYEVQIDVKINSSGEYNLKFRIDAKKDKASLNNIIAYDYSTQLFKYQADGYYYSTTTVSGGEKITLFKGVVLDKVYEDTLNSSNFSMDIYVYLEKVN